MALVERRYAEALVDISVQRGLIDIIGQELGSIAVILKMQPELWSFLLNPEVKTESKKAVMRKVFENRVTPELVNFLLLLLDKGRIKFLPGILEEFNKLSDRIKNVLNMTIVSAFPLDEMQINKIKQKYKQKYNAFSVKAVVEVDGSLLGGVKVKIGDKVIDGTITGRLNSLKELVLQG